MKKNTIIIIIFLVAAVVLCVCGIKYAADATEKNLQTLISDEVIETTTEIEETTAEVEETTTETEVTTSKVKNEEPERYENPFYFKKVQLTSSELPFNFGYPNAVGEVNMYVPQENVISSEDTWENTYVVVEHHKNSEVIIKLDKADGIITGNIVPKEEMEISNLTFVYLDGKLSQEYTMDRDGDMIILKDFPEGVKEIHIKNRSSNPIYVGEISQENVYISDIIINITG